MSDIHWVRDHYDNGNLHFEIPYVNNKKHGLKRVYRFNQEVWTETVYKNDLRDGQHILYYKGGSPFMIASYTRGERHGTIIYYNRNGNVSSEKHYISGWVVTKEEWRKHELITQLAEL